MRSFNEDQMKKNMVSYRVRKGLTQTDVARVLKVHPKTVCRWENNPERIPVDILDQLALIYGIAIKDFFVD